MEPETCTGPHYWVPDYFHRRINLLKKSHQFKHGIQGFDQTDLNYIDRIFHRNEHKLFTYDLHVNPLNIVETGFMLNSKSATDPKTVNTKSLKSFNICQKSCPSGRIQTSYRQSIYSFIAHIAALPLTNELNACKGSFEF